MGNVNSSLPPRTSGIVVISSVLPNFIHLGGKIISLHPSLQVLPYRTKSCCMSPVASQSRVISTAVGWRAMAIEMTREDDLRSEAPDGA